MPCADTWELIALSDFNTRLLRTGRGRRRRLAHIPSDAVSTAIGWADVVDGAPLDKLLSLSGQQSRSVDHSVRSVSPGRRGSRTRSDCGGGPSGIETSRS